MAEQVGAERLLQELEFVPLPEGWTPRQACLLIKCTDDDGVPTWAIRTTDDMSDEELLGVMVVRVEMLRSALVEEYVDPEYS